MSHKKAKKKAFFPNFKKQAHHIFADVKFTYKNILHWVLSKIIISCWSVVLWILVALPFIIIAIIAGLIDPISWSQIISYILTWSDASTELINSMAAHPYWLVFMTLMFVVTAFFFLLASSYNLFLLSRLSLSYVAGKKLVIKKNLYFDVRYILRFMWILCWNIMYLLAPIMIWAWIVFFMYFFFNIWFISFNTLSLLIAVYTFILILSLIYLVYRIIFWYVILADDTRKKHLWTSRSYVRKSIDITSGGNFFRFFIMCIVYSLVLLPFTSISTYYEEQSWYMRDTLIYKSGLLDNLEPKKIQYYEYISKEFKYLSNDEITSRLQMYWYIQIILYFIGYFLFSGLFILLICSFYKRVLTKK